MLPQQLFQVIQNLRRIGYTPPAIIDQLRARHEAIQTNEPETIVLRPGIALRVNPQSRFPFEWFCYRSPEMVRELDCFVAHAASFSSFVDVGANHGIFSLAFSAFYIKDGRIDAACTINQSRDANAIKRLIGKAGINPENHAVAAQQQQHDGGDHPLEKAAEHARP